MRRIITVLCVCLGVVTLAMAEPQVILESSVDRSELRLDEQLILNVSITGKDLKTINAPQLPEFQNTFAVLSRSQSSSYSYLNGTVSNSKTFRFVLQPLSVGVFVIPPVHLDVEKESFSTDPIKVKVLKAGLNELTQSASENIQDAPTDTPAQNLVTDAAVLVSAKVDQSEVFVGEPIQYTLTFYRRVSIWSSISMNLPLFSGFWTETQATQEEYLATIGGRKYYVFELAKKSLYPLESGELVIPAAQVAFVLNPFEGKRVLSSESVTINAVELPSDAPPQFDGAVGVFELSVSENLKSVPQNAATSLSVVLEGRGNINVIKELVVSENNDFRLYQSKMVETETGRVFEYVLVPQVSGEIKLPRFSLTYFSPETRLYETVSTEEMSLEVTKSENQGVEASLNREKQVISGEDIRYLKTEDQVTTDTDFTKDPVIMGIFLMNVFIFFGIVLYRGKSIFSNRTIGFRPSQKALAQAVTALNKSLPTDQTQSTSHISTIIFNYIQEKISQGVRHMTQDEVIMLLHQKGVSEKTLRELGLILNQVAELGFSQSSLTIDQIQELRSRSAALLQEIDKELGL